MVHCKGNILFLLGDHILAHHCSPICTVQTVSDAQEAEPIILSKVILSKMSQNCSSTKSGLMYFSNIDIYERSSNRAGHQYRFAS